MVVEQTKMAVPQQVLPAVEAEIPLIWTVLIMLAQWLMVAVATKMVVLLPAACVAAARQ